MLKKAMHYIMNHKDVNFTKHSMYYAIPNTPTYFFLFIFLLKMCAHQKWIELFA